MATSQNDEKAKYIMTPALFNRLSNVYGFNEHNGNTYQHHIVFMFSDHLDQETKDLILNTPDITESLQILKNKGINYTHEWVEN